MSLMEKVLAAPKYDGNGRKKHKSHCWVKYKEAFFFLVNEKDYTPKSAVRFIAKEEKLKPLEEKRLYQAQKAWKRK